MNLMTLTDLTPLQEKTVDIMSVILAILLIVSVLCLIAYWIVQDIITQGYKKEFIEKLDEHDKALIKTYENLKWTPRKKNKK